MSDRIQNLKPAVRIVTGSEHATSAVVKYRFASGLKGRIHIEQKYAVEAGGPTRHIVTCGPTDPGIEVNVEREYALMENVLELGLDLALDPRWKQWWDAVIDQSEGSRGLYAYLIKVATLVETVKEEQKLEWDEHLDWIELMTDISNRLMAEGLEGNPKRQLGDVRLPDPRQIVTQCVEAALDATTKRLTTNIPTK